MPVLHGHQETDGISDQVRSEIETRTPGFQAWQMERWLSCCRDAASFLGRAGAKELQQEFRKAIPFVKKCLRRGLDLSKEGGEEFFELLSKDGQATAYIFRCLHCNKYLAYFDET